MEDRDYELLVNAAKCRFGDQFRISHAGNTINVVLDEPGSSVIWNPLNSIVDCMEMFEWMTSPEPEGLGFVCYIDYEAWDFKGDEINEHAGSRTEPREVTVVLERSGKSDENGEKIEWACSGENITKNRGLYYALVEAMAEAFNNSLKCKARKRGHDENIQAEIPMSQNSNK